MQNKKILALMILGIVAVFSLAYGILTPSKVKREISRGSVIVPQHEITAVASKDISVARRAKRTSYTSWARNPFSLHEGAVTTVGSLLLNGILWDESSPAAIINDEILSVGNKIGPYTITEIRKDKVILTDGTTTHDLLLSH